MTAGRVEARGILPPRGLLISLAAQIPGALWWGTPDVSPGSVLTGTGMLAAGAWLNVQAVLLFRRNAAGVCPFSPVACLVQSGVYRFTRNPMYLGLVLISAALPVITAVPVNFWAPAALALWLHYRFILREENFLEELLGTEYLRYASRTPRWLGLPGYEILRSRSG
jgi:protein-S-isoprenylcysteine O-methyltransferase Ste14